MSELPSTPIPADEAQDIMRSDVVALLSNDAFDPLARAIEEALAALDRAIEAHRDEP